jgi:hypothetical protein
VPHGPTIFPSKGCCIYCRNSELPLTDEHIIPYSLGGRHVIKHASCRFCQDITSKIERSIAKGMWEDGRIAYDAPSYRKKRRPTHISVPNHQPELPTIMIPYNEYPAMMVFYWMQPAGILQGMPEDVDISKFWLLKAITDDKKVAALEAKYPGRLVTRFRHEPENFGRLLAKIGYGQILTQLDVTDFEPICLPYILGKKKNVSFIVGGNPNPANKMEFGYYMSTAGFGTVERMMLIAEVKLFADQDTPLYHVVVGDIKGRDKVAAALTKINSQGKIELVPNIALNRPPQLHWQPVVWPPPYWG